jgi:hypothetical protein
LDLRSFGPGRLGPQDDRLVSGARAEKRRQGAALHERRTQAESDPKRKANPRPTLTKRGWGTRKPVRNPRAQSGVTVQQKANPREKRPLRKAASTGRRKKPERTASEGGPYTRKRNPRTDLKVGHYKGEPKRKAPASALRFAQGKRAAATKANPRERPQKITPCGSWGLPW